MRIYESDLPRFLKNFILELAREGKEISEEMVVK